MRRARSITLARLASTAGEGAVDIRYGASTTLNIAKRKISMSVRIPQGRDEPARQVVLRGRLIGDGKSGSLRIAFSKVDVRKTTRQIELRQEVEDLSGLTGELRIEGDDILVDVAGLDKVGRSAFGTDVKGTRFSLRTSLRPAPTGPATGRTASLVNMTTVEVGDQLDATRWIIEVAEGGGKAMRSFELAGLVDRKSGTVHALTVAEVGKQSFGIGALEGQFERQILGSLKARGLENARLEGGIRSAD